ncbi:MAG: S8 family serine peptidase, partial [Holophagales bacterium]|nr:S8 family serine peptidase [Holophagales bacterium]
MPSFPIPISPAVPAAFVFAVSIGVVLAVPPVAAVPPADGDPGSNLRQKADAWVLDRLEQEREVEFLVVLGEQADVSGAYELPTKRAKGRHVFERLRQMAASTQGPLLAELRRLGVSHRAFYVHNMVWVRGSSELARTLARRGDVAALRANPQVSLDRLGLLGRGEEGASDCPAAVSSGVAHTGAPDLWAQGITGQGVVVAGQDTGYDWDHVALRDAYRGWNGISASHGYNWHDAIHSEGGICGADSPEPCDDHSHGTHTLGTMVGDNGSEVMGMAPGARWIGCRNMDRGNGTPATYTECFEFFLAPTDSAGQNPDPDLAPDVINNSWECSAVEGCTDPNVMKTVVENLRAAGVVVVASAGNSGPGCSSVANPSAIYDASFTVG